MSETHRDWKLMLASYGPRVHGHKYIIEEKDVAHCCVVDEMVQCHPKNNNSVP